MPYMKYRNLIAKVTGYKINSEKDCLRFIEDVIEDTLNLNHDPGKYSLESQLLQFERIYESWDKEQDRLELERPK